MFAKQLPVAGLSIVYVVTAPLAVFALGGGPQVGTPDSQPASDIERALIERTCGAADILAPETEAHQQCFNAQLLSLRADFGRDLGRLSAADRKRIDAACNSLRSELRREPYVNCLGDQLAASRKRQGRWNSVAPENAAVAPAQPLEPLVAPGPPEPAQASSRRNATIAGGVVVGVLAVAGVGFLAVRSRRPRHTCRVCGVSVPDADLCPTCRHEAAEALRRASVERTQTQRTQEEETRRQREHEAELRERQAREDEQARLRQQELVRQKQEEEEARRLSAAAVAVVPVVEEEAVFDPYAVLGVPREAGPDDIRTAYQQAKSKYDPVQVSYLGDEIQAHFRVKAESVERAFQLLSGVPQ